MTTTTTGSAHHPEPRPRNLYWVARRAALGLALILTLSVAAATLIDAGIDPSQVQESE